ncbi:hypothetical protein EDB80DRAFT_780978 [Ilyonectria destructans]|nr:hypothetical protein EDB80DRAFT_780978 [Ilyonectria destructans]
METSIERSLPSIFSRLYPLVDFPPPRGSDGRCRRHGYHAYVRGMVTCQGPALDLFGPAQTLQARGQSRFFGRHDGRDAQFMRVAGRSLHFALIPFLIPRMLDEDGFNPAFWIRKAQDGLEGCVSFPKCNSESQSPSASILSVGDLQCFMVLVLLLAFCLSGGGHPHHAMLGSQRVPFLVVIVCGHIPNGNRLTPVVLGPAGEGAGAR